MRRIRWEATRSSQSRNGRAVSIDGSFIGQRGAESRLQIPYRKHPRMKRGVHVSKRFLFVGILVDDISGQTERFTFVWTRGLCAG